MKFISWNVNGLRACAGKGFGDVFRSLDADFFCIQETKMQEGQLDLQFEGYKSYWNYADKKGYSGTAVFTRLEPLSVRYGIGIDEHDHEGRVITLEMNDFYLVCVYVPNSQEELRRLDYRMRWDDDFRTYLCGLAEKKGVIVCGDLNVAHQEIDLKNPASNRRNSGFTDEERGKFSDWLGAGFVDTWRALNPDKVQYSWWSYRFKAREKNIGWRIDRHSRRDFRFRPLPRGAGDGFVGLDGIHLFSATARVFHPGGIFSVVVRANHLTVNMPLRIRVGVPRLSGDAKTR